eukprot:TRINITY_DN44653_c0_g1_i1.p1 TRINITY_DN44653_c0_g1~~TRINITY_DN44653_c0_g1_i1.p1  ORF type:complete len:611 (-),score=123.83 TRINITY_DN44653_c0_g1_i1:195-2027(-)
MAGSGRSVTIEDKSSSGRGRRVSSMDEPGRKFDARTFMPARVNAEISKRYDLDRNEIGSGGYGKVFKARDKNTKDRFVAIKKVIISDDAKKHAFLKEASIMKDLDHPHICRLLETYEQGRFMFFVMEYCEGGEVFDRIMESGMIEEAITADIVRQSASALTYAHKRGIAHRDMKPENICFCSRDVTNNNIKLIDWGLGFYFGQARMHSSVGSLTYAAPEVLESKPQDGYTFACDAWSVGVLTYVMLCGKPPFWGNFNEQLKRMKKESFPMHDATWKSISNDAKDMIKALLRANPKNRMSLDAVLQCSWLRKPSRANIDAKVAGEVLLNLRRFSNTSHFFSICVASVARQLDHRRLCDVHKVFAEMDSNGDGVLELHEVRRGFEKVFGADSVMVKDVERIFARLDLDGSGAIDYTEFCAAGIGQRMTLEENTLWAAFKTFDVQDDDERITKEEIKQVLSNGSVNDLWSQEVCQDVVEEVFELFDRNGDGSLDFQEFVKLMRECANRQAGDVPPDEQELLEELQNAERQPGMAYAILSKHDESRRDPSSSPGACREAALMTFGEPDRGIGERLSGALRQLSVHFERGEAASCFAPFACKANGSGSGSNCAVQ